MNKIYRLITKNLRLLIRSKVSALVVILGPLLLIFLVGLAFDNSNTYSVNIGAYASEYNNLTYSFIDKISKDLTVQKFDSEEECIQSLREGRIHTCLVFSDDFEVGGENNDIAFYVDYSKINLVYVILDQLSLKIEERQEEISSDITTTVLEKIENTKEALNVKKELLVKLVSAETQVNKELVEVDKKLKSLNLDVNVVDAGDAVEGVNELTDLTGYVLVHFNAMSAQIKGKINSLAQENNGSQETKEKIFESIDQTKLRLEAINQKLVDNSGDLTSAIEGVSDNLRIMQNQLKAAGLARTDVYGQVSTIQSLVAENLVVILQMQDTINQIEKDLESIEFTSSKDIVNPVTTTIKPITAGKTNLDFVFPSLIVLVIMFISILLSSTLVIMEKKSRAYFRNFITPVRDITKVVATLLTAMTLLLGQLVIIVGVSAIFFQQQILGSLLVTFVGLVFVSGMFSMIGLIIGYIFDSEEIATLASISIGAVMLLLSNTLLPLESMPRYLLQISQYNPFVIAESFLRKATVFGASFGEVWWELLLLVGYSLVLFGLAYVAERSSKRNFLTQYARKFAPKKK